MPQLHHGLDWNVFTLPLPAPLGFLEEQHPLTSAGLSSPTVFENGGLSAEAMEQRAFGWIVVIVGALLVSFQLIPKFHACRARLKSLNIALPVH